MRRAKAFCPGHVTGFFEICPNRDALATGSRGAGMCLSLGATSEVSVSDSSRQAIEVFVNGGRCEARVTRAAIRYLIGNDRLRVRVSTVLDLPEGQGFGMSAAGALSVSLALAEITGHTRQRAFEAAHTSEVMGGGGLGDVSALHRGGITIRRKPGLPPIGEVLRIDGEPEVVLATVGRKMLTKSVLSNPGKRRAINESGGRRVDLLVKNPTVQNLMDLSSSFAVESGLASKQVLHAMNAASRLGMASMSMLGNSVFSIGNTDGLKRVLSDFGPVYSCTVSEEGPMVL
ncbi:MAG: pantoate kinase [Thermoplasmata archaeon]